MKVKEIINEINEQRMQRFQDGTNERKIYDTKNRRDEQRVMRALMNDMNYEVDVYKTGHEGPVNKINPSKLLKTTVANAMTKITGMNRVEAAHLMSLYEFDNHDANRMLEFTKEFINVYLQTGRKLPLGGRKDSDISLVGRVMESNTLKYPVKTGKVDENGKEIFETKEVEVPEYRYAKAYCKCPSWKK